MTFRGYYPDHKIPFKRGDLVVVPKGTLICGTGGAPKVSSRMQKVKVHHTMPGSMALLFEKLDSGRFYFCYVDQVMERKLRDADATEALNLIQRTYTGWSCAEEIIQDLEDRDLLRWDGNKCYLVLSNPMVVWPGTGGYWREAEVNSVTLHKT
jgi:hypothetical protein